MKILLACEGQSEVFLLNSLIEKGYLNFKYPLLLDEPIRLRQLAEIAPIINALPINEEIIIYRVGDTLKEDFDLSKFKMRINHMKVYKVCTKPEIEVLVIINKGIYTEYIKKSKKYRPKSFVNSKFKDFDIESYFSSNDLSNAIREYKRLKKHNKDELYLADLLTK